LRSLKRPQGRQVQQQKRSSSNHRRAALFCGRRPSALELGAQRYRHTAFGQSRLDLDQGNIPLLGEQPLDEVTMRFDPARVAVTSARLGNRPTMLKSKAPPANSARNADIKMGCSRSATHAAVDRSDRCFALRETIGPIRVEAQGPVPHDLQCDPGNLRRIAPAAAIQDQRYRQQASNLIRIAASSHKPPQIRRCMIRSNPNRCRHRKPPCACSIESGQPANGNPTT